MKLTLEEAIRLHAGLSQLDGYDRAVKDGDRERVVRELYKLSIGILVIIGANIDALEKPITAYRKASRRRLMEVGVPSKDEKGNAEVKIPPEKMAAYSEEDRKLLEEEIEVDVKKFRIDDLKPGFEDGQNKIPPSVIAMISLCLMNSGA